MVVGTGGGVEWEGAQEAARAEKATWKETDNAG